MEVPTDQFRALTEEAAALNRRVDVLMLLLRGFTEGWREPAGQAAPKQERHLRAVNGGGKP
jgi:hypothetical protein